MYKEILYSALGTGLLAMQATLVYCFGYLTIDIVLLLVMYVACCVIACIAMFLRQSQMRVFWILLTITLPGVSLLARDMTESQTYFWAGIYYWILFCVIVNIVT